MRNNIRIKGDTVEIELAEGRICLIDLDDLEKVHNATKRSWLAYKSKTDTTHYVRVMKPDGKILSLHRFIMDAEEGVLVDHKNRNGLDNRRRNLREATHIENSRNNINVINNPSGCPGVVWHKRDKTWRATIKVSGRKVHLGQSKDLKEAIEIRKKGEEKYWGYRT